MFGSASLRCDILNENKTEVCQFFLKKRRQSSSSYGYYVEIVYTNNYHPVQSSCSCLLDSSSSISSKHSFVQFSHYVEILGPPREPVNAFYISLFSQFLELKLCHFCKRFSFHVFTSVCLKTVFRNYFNTNLKCC